MMIFSIVFPVVSCFLSQKLSVFQVYEDIDGNRCIESHNFITTCVLHYKDKINSNNSLGFEQTIFRNLTSKGR